MITFIVSDSSVKWCLQEAGMPVSPSEYFVRCRHMYCGLADIKKEQNKRVPT